MGSIICSMYKILDTFGKLSAEVPPPPIDPFWAKKQKRTEMWRGSTFYARDCFNLYTKKV